MINEDILNDALTYKDRPRIRKLAEDYHRVIAIIYSQNGNPDQYGLDFQDMLLARLQMFPEDEQVAFLNKYSEELEAINTQKFHEADMIMLDNVRSEQNWTAIGSILGAIILFIAIIFIFSR